MRKNFLPTLNKHLLQPFKNIYINTLHYNTFPISIDGYEKLLIDLEEILPQLNGQVKAEFELQDEKVLRSSLLLDYNIKPRDILDIVQTEDLDEFSKQRDIKTRGNKIENILDAYKDSENLYLENYVNIGFRNLNVLKENGINAYLHTVRIQCR